MAITFAAERCSRRSHHCTPFSFLPQEDLREKSFFPTDDKAAGLPPWFHPPLQRKKTSSDRAVDDH